MHFQLANLTAATGGNVLLTQCQRSPASSLTHKPPVVDAMANVRPSVLTHKLWR
jgi:hypothetical protein